MAKSRSIKITNLLANTENYRFETVASQKEAIDKMLDDQGENLLNLADHIVKFGLNPNDRIEVTASNIHRKKFNVLEGNRRTIALKLLNNPDLIEGLKFESLKRKFKKLHEANKENLIAEVDCLVFDNPADADVWIGLKHGYGQSGVFTDNWGALQKQRFQERTEGKTSTSLQIIKLMKSADEVPEDIKKNLHRISTTNLDRLIDDPDVRSFLGIEINSGVIQSSINEKEVIKGLTQVVKHILNPKFTVKQIYSKDDRKQYLANFPKTSKPDTSKKSLKPWQFSAIHSQVSNSSSAKASPHPKDRKKLIPRNCTIKISNAKVNKIYHELMGMDIVKYTNGGAVLFRVFVELSVDSYIEKHRLASTPSAAKSNMNFQQKMNVVANHLTTINQADSAICKGVKAAIKDPNDILGIDTWHAYVHNNRFAPKASNLIITWDNMQDFMVILWANIK